MKPTDEWIANEAGKWLRMARTAFAKQAAAMEHVHINFVGGGNASRHPRLNRSEYRAYIASEAWKQYRRERLIAAGFICDYCGIGDADCRKRYGTGLNVHHIHYDTLGHEHITDTNVLCNRCHVFAECEQTDHRRVVPDRTKSAGIRCTCDESPYQYDCDQNLNSRPI